MTTQFDMTEKLFCFQEIGFFDEAEIARREESGLHPRPLLFCCPAGCHHWAPEATAEIGADEDGPYITIASSQPSDSKLHIRPYSCVTWSQPGSPTHRADQWPSAIEHFGLQDPERAA